MNRNQEMLSGAPYRALVLKLCVPSIVIMLVMIAYNMADTFFIGQSGDANRIAAVSLCGPLFAVLSGLGTLLGNGSCIAISLSLGKQDSGRIRAIAGFCFVGCLVIGTAFLLPVLLFTEPVCVALGADEGTLAYAAGYLRIIALGAPIVMIANVFTNMIRADGATVNSMICNLIGTVTNIVLDALFILVFDWGVEGAALATILGNLAGCIYLFRYTRIRQPLFAFGLSDLRPDGKIAREVLPLGLPMSLGTLLMSFSHIFSNRLMMRYSATALAAQGVSGKLGMVITMLIMGITMGLQPAISYNYGSKNLARVKYILKRTLFFTTALGVLLSAFCYFVREPIVSAFIDDAAIIAYSRVMVLASVSVGPFYGIYQLCQTFLQSTGKASFAIVLALLDKGLIYVPCLYAMNALFGLYGIVFTGAVTLVLSLIIGILLCLRWSKNAFAIA